MKTSNKLLIAFAAILIAVPVLVMAYFSKVYYTDAKNFTNLEKQNDSFDANSESMEAIPLSQFSTISLADGKGINLYNRIIKDHKYGLKINKQDKDLIKCSVNQAGQLQIALTDKIKGHYNISLFVYAPETKAINIDNASSISLNAKGDSLLVNLKKFSDLKFDEATLFNKLSINADGLGTSSDAVNRIDIESKITNSLHLNLKHSNFRSESVSYQDLNITSVGKNEIQVFGDRDNKEKFTIKNLYLTTIDSANVTFKSIDIANAKGSLSNQTSIQLPVINLKQLLK